MIFNHQYLIFNHRQYLKLSLSCPFLLKTVQRYGKMQIYANFFPPFSLSPLLTPSLPLLRSTSAAPQPLPGSTSVAFPSLFLRFSSAPLPLPGSTSVAFPSLFLRFSSAFLSLPRRTSAAPPSLLFRSPIALPSPLCLFFYAPPSLLFRSSVAPQSLLFRSPVPPPPLPVSLLYFPPHTHGKMHRRYCNIIRKLLSDYLVIIG